MASFPLADAAWADRLGPLEKIEALRAQPEERYPFVLRFAEGVRPDLNSLLPAPAVGPDVTPLPSVNGLAATLRVADALALEGHPALTQVWYLHPELAPFYIRVMKALEVGPGIGANLVNLSLGPEPRFWPKTPYADEPMHAATQAAAEAGQVLVIAIGNSGGAGEGWTNPWCLPEWVICVGAHDRTTSKVAAFSSRGRMDRPETWPDVLGDGVDVVGPYPTGMAKSAQRRQKDEGSAHFRRNVPPADWHLYTLESGTSQATANVTGAAAQILHFLKAAIGDAPVADGRPIFELQAPPGRVADLTAATPRLTGSATPGVDGSVTYSYWLDQPWKMVKQLLVDTALPIAGEPPNAAGAGLVDRAYVNAQFGRFGLAEPQIIPRKVTE